MCVTLLKHCLYVVLLTFENKCKMGDQIPPIVQEAFVCARVLVRATS